MLIMLVVVFGFALSLALLNKFGRRRVDTD